MKRRCALVCSLILGWLLLGVSPLSWAGEAEVRLGVLANRGRQQCLERWAATADYLSASIPGVRFRIVPLAFEEIDAVAAAGRVDFILVNSGIYVEIESRYGVSRIASLKNWNRGQSHALFGGLVVCRQERHDIQKMTDLRGKRVQAVDPTSLGGWLMVLRELRAKGIWPERDFASLRFAGTHDEVVLAVLNGEADVGCVRTDTLEKMEAEGKIRLADLRVIHDHVPDGESLPFPHSTRAYPEWPMAKLRQTPDGLAEKVAVALLAMPADSPAARAAKCAGWTIPSNYQPVHDCLRELHLGPYQDLDRVDLAQVARTYWPVILGFMVLLLSVVGAGLHVLRLKNAINRSYGELDQIFNTAAGGMRVVDTEFRMLRANRTYLAMLGIGDHDWQGRACHEVMPGTMCRTGDCPLTRIMAGDEHVEMEVDKVAPDGRVFPCLLTVRPFRDPEGRLLGMIEDFRDITQLKKAEQALVLQKEREARQAAMAHSGRMAALGQMATAMAHEINQPLSVISVTLQAWAARLRRGSLDSAAMLEKDIPRVLGNVERISRLIEHVRSFGRTDASRQPVDVKAVAQDALSLCRHQFRARGIELVEAYASELPAVSAVAGELEQVVLNLLANARQAVEDKQAVTPDFQGAVTVSTALVEQRVVVRVQDNGTGVPPDQVAFIFDPFFTTKPSGKGTGLGLHLCLQIMERLGGGINLFNQPGQGACFEAWLPVSQESPA
ncbi:MAG: PhnD/SsuA/transferrin family substrate-binding protein [Thermodesulfobacteriota bacterium]